MKPFREFFKEKTGSDLAPKPGGRIDDFIWSLCEACADFMDGLAQASGDGRISMRIESPIIGFGMTTIIFKPDLSDLDDSYRAKVLEEIVMGRAPFGAARAVTDALRQKL